MGGQPKAEDLLERLADRHARDVFVVECKMGETWHAQPRTLDAWAMRKSWSPFTTIGYEVKVARSDFLRDEKWHGYLPACHEFYFVTPRNLVDPRELPQDVGLLWPAGQRLHTKRKAVRREPDAESLVLLMAYVLMSRTRIVANMHEANGPSAVDRWRAWLLEDTGEQWLGHMVSRRLGERVRRAEKEAREAKALAARHQQLEERLRELGANPEHPLSLAELEAKLDGNRQQAALRRVLRLSEQAAEIARGAVE